jgi:FdhD protein
LWISGSSKLLLNFYNILNKDLNIRKSIIFSLPEKLMNNQKLFKITGGLHAAALFDLEGELLVLREDVGRGRTFIEVS